MQSCLPPGPNSRLAHDLQKQANVAAAHLRRELPEKPDVALSRVPSLGSHSLDSARVCRAFGRIMKAESGMGRSNDTQALETAPGV